jgi:hypothetical protein
MKTEKLILLAVVAAVLYSVFSEKKKDESYGGVVGKFGPGGTLGPTGDFVPGGGDFGANSGATGSW